MIFNKHVFLAVVVAAYAATFIATFDELYDSVQISSIALIGLYGWFYGTRIGLFSIVPFVLLNTAILYLVSGKPYDILLTYNPVGIIMAMFIVLIIGATRESYDQLKELQRTLASRIDQATSELNQLAQQLIEYDERDRIGIGQDLHDGVGQYLTGMLLHSEALCVKLRKTNPSEADRTEQMVQQIHKNIRDVRTLSRSLLPIQFTRTTLETALDEMVAYFNEASEVNLRLKCNGSGADLPSLTAQHLHRITHEAIHRAIFWHQVTDMQIGIIIEKQSYQIQMKGWGISEKSNKPTEFISKVMKYRAIAIGAKLTFHSPAKDHFLMECSSAYGEEAE